MSEECNVVRNREGFLVNTCTGEVLGFDNYSFEDFSKSEYRERVNTVKKSRPDKLRKGVKNMNEIIMGYLLSVMNDEEKDKFYRILNKIGEHRKPDPALFLAIYEYITVKEGKRVNREYIRFIKMRGIGKYTIRQRKKLLMKVLKEDPVLEFISTLEPEVRNEALKLYEILKKKNLIYGKAETRKRILLEYLNDYNKKKEVLEMELFEELIRWNFNYATII